jgi:hypothetical protein
MVDQVGSEGVIEEEGAGSHVRITSRPVPVGLPASVSYARPMSAAAVGPPDALYLMEGNRALPGPLTAGPWSPDSQHGGPVAALLARAVESISTPAPMQVVRLTVELLRPVPLAPMDIATAVVRMGTRVGFVEASASTGGTLVATSRALMIRVGAVSVPAPEQWPVTPTDPAAAVPRPRSPDDPAAFHLDAMEMRFARGSWEGGGPAVVWERLAVPVVAGEEPSPLQRAMAAADSGNGISRVVPFAEFVFVNPDLTVALSRPPAGEWIGLDVRTRLDGRGWGQADSLLFDAQGPCGRAVQSLYVEAR